MTRSGQDFKAVHAKLMLLKPDVINYILEIDTYISG